MKHLFYSLLLILPMSAQAQPQTLNNLTITEGTSLNMSLSNPVLSGGTETIAPIDRPGSAGTALPNTFWVDTYYAPKNWFVSHNTTWNVCTSGCTFTQPLDAWRAALATNIINNAIITIQISDGIYNVPDQFYTERAQTHNVHIIGNTRNPSHVVLNFTHTKGTNLAGFAAYQGGNIGMIDGMTIQTPTDGTGALASTDSEGRNIWNAQSYGAGISSYGTGSNVRLGNHIVIHGFYYSLVADNNGGIYAPNGGVTMSLAGDVNAMARGGGVIVCTPCSASNASDYTLPSTTVLGSNYDAERGGSLYIDGSKASDALINGLVGLTGGHVWAHNMIFTGGLNGGGTGVWITGTSSAELTGSTISHYTNGVLAQSGGVAFPDKTTIQDCSYGIIADNGRISGDTVSISGSHTVAIQALHTGSVLLFNTTANLVHNAASIWVQNAGTSSNGSNWAASSVSVQ